jgi:hypothetical protein
LIHFFRKPKPKRHVVFHSNAMKESLEGVWDGTLIDGHYPLTFPKILLSEGRKRDVVGDLLIPKQNVTFIQVLSEDASR